MLHFIASAMVGKLNKNYKIWKYSSILQRTKSRCMRHRWFRYSRMVQSVEQRKMWWKEDISNRNELAEKNLRNFKNPKAPKWVQSMHARSTRNAVFHNSEETTQLVRARGKNGRKSSTSMCYNIEGKRSRESQVQTWMDNKKEDLKTQEYKHKNWQHRVFGKRQNRPKADGRERICL